MFEQISIIITAAILGIMVFFSFVIAPVTFTSLNEENAETNQQVVENSEDSKTEESKETEEVVVENSEESKTEESKETSDETKKEESKDS